MRQRHNTGCGYVDFIFKHGSPFKKFRSVPSSGNINAFTFLPDFSVVTLGYNPIIAVFIKEASEGKSRDNPTGFTRK